MGLDLTKVKKPPARETTTSHPALSVAWSTAMAKVAAAMNTPSPTKGCKRWGLPCLFCTQSAPHPSPVKSEWSQEDWDGEILKKKRGKQGKEEEMRQRQEEKGDILDSNYYPLEPMYVSNHNEQPPT